MKHSAVKTRWQLCVVVACVLVCVFAFNAKVSQYESVHKRVNDVSSNKIWSSTDERSGTPAAMADLAAFQSPAGISIPLLAFVLLTDSKIRRIGFLDFEPASPAMAQVSTAELFRRPPPVR